MSVIVPDAWMPVAAMKRIIVHWTAGGYTANAVDRAAYHILIEESGKLVRGTHSIVDNVSTADGNYAAHTLKCNTGSIGVSMCCMHQCVEKPFAAGKFPLTDRQWQAMLQVVAQLCRRYGIDVTPQTVLGHGEVQKNLGILQKSKWDPMVLPWQPGLSREQVGDLLRDRIREILEPHVPISVDLMGTQIGEDDALIQDGQVFIAANELQPALGWRIQKIDEDEASVELTPGQSVTVPALDRGGRQFVSFSILVDDLGRTVTWDSLSRTVTVR